MLNCKLTKNFEWKIQLIYTLKKEPVSGKMAYLELVSKELNHFAAILHVYTGGL